MVVFECVCGGGAPPLQVHSGRREVSGGDVMSRDTSAKSNVGAHFWFM